MSEENVRRDLFTGSQWKSIAVRDLGFGSLFEAMWSPTSKQIICIGRDNHSYLRKLFSVEVSAEGNLTPLWWKENERFILSSNACQLAAINQEWLFSLLNDGSIEGLRFGTGEEFPFHDWPTTEESVRQHAHIMYDQGMIIYWGEGGLDVKTLDDRIVRQVRDEGEIEAVAVSPDGNSITASSQKSLHLFDLRYDRRDHALPISAFCRPGISPINGAIDLIDHLGPFVLVCSSDHEQPLVYLVGTQEGRIICGIDPQVKWIYQLKGIEPCEVQFLVFSGNRSSGNDFHLAGDLHLRDMHGNRASAHSFGSHYATISPDGKWLAMLGDYDLRVAPVADYFRKV